MRNSNKAKQTYFRYCKGCQIKFKPKGRYTFYCDECSGRRYMERKTTSKR